MHHFSIIIIYNIFNGFLKKRELSRISNPHIEWGDVLLPPGGLVSWRDYPPPLLSKTIPYSRRPNLSFYFLSLHCTGWEEEFVVVRGRQKKQIQKIFGCDSYYRCDGPKEWPPFSSVRPFVRIRMFVCTSVSYKNITFLVSCMRASSLSAQLSLAHILTLKSCLKYQLSLVPVLSNILISIFMIYALW